MSPVNVSPSKEHTFCTEISPLLGFADRLQLPQPNTLETTLTFGEIFFAQTNGALTIS